MKYSSEHSVGYSLLEINSIRTFLENISDLYWIFDNENVIERSKNFNAILKAENFAREIDLFRDLVVEEEFETLELWLEKIQNVEVFKSDIKLCLPDNTEEWFHVVSVPIKNENGELKFRAGYMKNISEQRRKEDDLYEMVERYENFISHTSEAIFRIEMEQPIDVSLPVKEQVNMIYERSYLAECNSAFANVSGMNNIYELIGKKISDIEKGNYCGKKEIKKFIELNYKLKNEIVSEKDESGNDLFFTNNLVGVVKDGKLIRCWGALLDITKQIKAEKKAKILSQAVEQIQVSVMIININGEIEYVNPQFENVSGYTFDEVRGKPFENFRSDKAKAEIYNEVKDRLKHNAQWNGTLRNKRKNGELFWESVKISPIKNLLGEVTNFVVIKEDITKSVKVQEELDKYRESLEELVDKRTREIKEQYNFLTSLIESLPHPVYVLSEGGKYKIINRSFEDFASLKKENILGKSVNEVGPFFLSDKGKIKRKKIIKRDNIDIFEVKIACSGSLVQNIIVYQTGLKSEGASGETLGVIHDITERKNLELQTKNALQRERELNQVKTNFISMVSHEFRTPLTAILTTAEFIERYFERINKEKLTSQIRNIYSSVERMTALLEDIIFLSRKESGKLEFRPEEINLSELVEKIISDISSLLVEKQAIEFNNQLTSDIYFLDKKLLYIILTNLLTNAVKYSPPDKKIYFTVMKCGGNIKFCIEDEGVGIKQSDYDKIFEPFYRTDEVSSIPGSGLGLSVVKEAVDAHKGKITFQSVLQKGTIFEVFIPISNGDDN